MTPLQRWGPAGVWLLTPVLVALLSSCAAGRIVPVGRLQSLAPASTTVALAPDGGVFADLIGIALAEHGFTVIDSGTTAALLVITQHSAVDLLRTQGLDMLRARGVEAVLIVDRADGKDGLPQTVRVRLYGTANGQVLGGIDWENSWIRRGVWESAQEIGAAIAEATEPTSASPSEQLDGSEAVLWQGRPGERQP